MKVLASLAASLLWVAAVLLRLHAAVPPPSQVSGSPLVDYEWQVMPIVKAHCLECHNAEKRKGGLSLATYGDALDGGRSGAVIRPGSSATSLLMQRIGGDIEPQMPKDNDPLSDADTAVIRAWIDQGARATSTSPPAPQPWEPVLSLERPSVPSTIWPRWNAPLDRLVAAYLSKQGTGEPERVSDAAFARRVYLDLWGLLPPPDALRSFLADGSAQKREKLVDRLLGDDQRYAEHWMSFWNDLLRNEDGTTYFSETASRKSITDWLFSSLKSNLGYDQFVAKLLNPVTPQDPEGFLVGVNWRGETSAAVTPWMQASQNTAQIFLGINLKCTSCHDSFINRWKLRDAYALAGFFSPQPRLQLNRCDVALDQFAEPAFLYPALNRPLRSIGLADRRATAAAIFTDSRNGRLSRTIVNRIWTRLLGHGIVANSDEMDGKPWSPEVLDWVASDFVAHGSNLRHLLRTIVLSGAYQMPAVARRDEPVARNYVFAGPEVRRMTAEQFADAIGSITGEWSVRPWTGRASSRSVGSDPVSAGAYAREWRVASTNLTRALGRPIRDQVISQRVAQSTTPQALELINGELLTRWLSFGARRMLGELPPEPPSLFVKSAGGRNATSRPFDIDVSNVSKMWLVVVESGSNAPERVQPVWLEAELSGPSGAVTLSSLTPVDGSGLRSPVNPSSTGIPVKNPSRLVYDIRGKGFTRFHGLIGFENSTSEIGSTLNPQVRFFVFDQEPNMDRLVPPMPDPPIPVGRDVRTSGDAIDRVFSHALGRAPSAEERRLAEATLNDPARPGRPSAAGLADLLWAIVMKPEFQLIY
jgi:Protein of unknown function (DUF1549)/Protein of unknown function (DUF1553)/Planctomycete cytochrome C